MKIIVASQQDPVGREVAHRLGVGSPTEHHIGMSPVRQLRPGLMLVKREALHIHDTSLAEEIPLGLATQIEALIFPSVHRSESNRPALTVHPLGNLGAEAEVGGLPLELNPVPARLMTEAFLRWQEVGSRVGIETTFEATHHGPWLRHPSFFIEIGATAAEWEREDALSALAGLLRDLEVERTAKSPVVLGVGGGHYMPRFRDLVRKRDVAVAHLVPSRVWGTLDRAMAEQLVARSPHVQGIVFAKAEDSGIGPATAQLLPPVREGDLATRS